MSYFSSFPNFIYEANEKSYVVKDILRRSVFISEYKPYSDLYEEYVITDSDTLQSIAEDYYGSPNYYWVVSMFNEIHDVKLEIPLSTDVLEASIETLYGADKNKIKYYVDTNTGLIVGEIKTYSSNYVEPPLPGEQAELYVPITFSEYENLNNEAKRNIKLLRKELLADFLAQFRESLNGN